MRFSAFGRFQYNTTTHVQMPYQCSESTTASEVAAVFDNAVARSRAMSQHGDIILVFLDVSFRRIRIVRTTHPPPDSRRPACHLRRGTL